MSDWTLHEGEALTWLMTLPAESAGALIVDPPYASGGRSNAERKRPPAEKYASATRRVFPGFPGDCRDQRSLTLWMTLWLLQCWRILRPGAPACVFSDWRQLGAMQDAFQAGGFIHRGTVAWDKTRAARPVTGRFTNQCEFVIWGSKGAMPLDRRCNSESNILDGLFTHRVIPAEKHHLTGKPVPLMRDIVRICEPGGLILDPLAGSGSTGVAALQLGYQFLGCELMPEYAAIARARLAEATSMSQASTGAQLSLLPGIG